MSYIFLFLLIINTSIGFATFFKKKFEETVFISIFSYILILFLSGAIINLLVGFYLILLINLLLLIYNIISIFKKRLSLKNQVFTFGFILFILSSCLIIWYSLGRKSVIWDEFSHWSLVVKNMYFLNNFGFGSDSTIMIKNYLSGTSLFQFFGMKLCGSFNESMLYVSMDLIILSTILPIFKHFNARKNFLVYLLFLVIFFIPNMFYGNVYSSLYVDGLLALLFAYSLYSYYSNYEEGLSKFNLINLAAALAMMVFAKDFGLVFACGVFGIILLDNLFIRNQFKFKNLWNNNKFLLLTILPMISIKLLWSIVLKINHVITLSSTSNLIPTTIKLFTMNLVDYQKTVVESFITAVFNNSLVTVFIPLTYAMCLGLIIILGYIIISNTQNLKFKTSMKLLISLSFLGGIFYAVLLLIVPYLSMFSEYEALHLASFERYISTYILGIIFMQLALIIRVLIPIKDKIEKFIIILFLIFVLNFPLFQIFTMTIGAREQVYSTIQTRNSFNKFIELTNQYVKQGEKTYFIATNTKGFEYYIAKYELTPKKLNETFAWSIGVPYSEDDIWTVNKSSSDFKVELLAEYDYVYLYNVDVQFIDLFGKLFQDKANIKNNQLYKVLKTEGSDSILEFVAE